MEALSHEVIDNVIGIMFDNKERQDQAQEP